MGLVNGKQGHFHGFQTVQKFRLQQPLRGNIEQIQRAAFNLLRDAAGLDNGQG